MVRSGAVGMAPRGAHTPAPRGRAPTRPFARARAVGALHPWETRTTTTAAFPHERLDAFHVAMDLFVGVEHLAARLPRGHADLKDQVRRAAAATVRNLAEGANRWSPRDKAARFTIALGECGECDATLAMASALRICDPQEVHALRKRAARVAAMLTGLIRRLA